MFRRNKRRGGRPESADEPVSPPGTDDVSTAGAAAANCVAYEADGGPDVNVGTEDELVVVSHAEATRMSYARHLVAKFDADLERIQAAAAGCLRRASADGAPTHVAKKYALAANLCDEAEQIVLAAGVTGNERQRRRLVAMCANDVGFLARSLGSSFAEVAEQQLAAELAEIDAEYPPDVDDLPETVPYQGPSYDESTGRFQIGVGRDAAGYWAINTPGEAMRHGLVAGPEGIGKTSALRLLAVEAICEPKFALWLVDPTSDDGITKTFEGAADRSATNPREAVELLREACRVVDQRLARRPTTGDPTPQKQGIVIIIDDAEALFADNLDAAALAEHVATHGGPVNVSLTVAVPDAELGHFGGSTALREALATTNCFTMGPNGAHMLRALGKLA